MIEIRETEAFAQWLAGLRDVTARRRIVQRLVRVEYGLVGDAKALGEGLHELRLVFGPGYRIYFCRRGETVILLLCGGDKSGQSRDIARARAMMAALEADDDDEA